MDVLKTPPGISMQTLLDRPLRRWPEKAALVDDRGTLSFAEVDEQARRLARALAAAGARPADRAAIILPNGMPFIVTEAAILRAGLVKVPLNIRFHVNEIMYSLADSEPKILICDQIYCDAVLSRRAELPGLAAIFVAGAQIRGCESYDEAVAGGESSGPAYSYRDDDPILIRYTGGTTGRPKGIVHTHRSFVEIHLDQLRELNFNERDVALHLGHLSHGLNFTWAAYYAAGATQIIHEKFEPRRVLDDFSRYRVTCVYMVPTMVQRLLREDDGTADVSSLRMFEYASAPMPVPVLRQAIARYGNIFTQVYTLSEAPVITTILRPHEHIDQETMAGNRLASCGREVISMELRLVDDDGNDVLAGEVGEIVVRSANNMAAYWRMPEETAKTLVNGWLHTGDMARQDEEGFLYLVDRKKDVIITGAFNVYPQEVENVLYRHPAVAQCAVVGVPDAEWGEAIKAFVVLQPGQTTSAEELIGLCRDNLASYKKPRFVEFVDTLPLSPVGKIMRRALRAP
jgi:fatty-acyl-CoA synthase/long-chain acyl-CoA synthetase